MSTTKETTVRLPVTIEKRSVWPKGSEHGLQAGDVKLVAKTEAEVKAFMLRELERVTTGSWMPVYLECFGHRRIIYRTWDGWRYNRLDKPGTLHDGVYDDFEKCARYARLDLAQEVYATTLFNDSEERLAKAFEAAIEVFAEHLDELDTFRSWCLFQMRYRALEAGGYDGDTHLLAGNGPRADAWPVHIPVPTLPEVAA